MSKEKKLRNYLLYKYIKFGKLKPVVAMQKVSIDLDLPDDDIIHPNNIKTIIDRYNNYTLRDINKLIKLETK